MKEMISEANWLGLGVFIAFTFIPLLIVRWMRGLKRFHGEIEARDLGHPATRLDLQQLLAKGNVVGDADIRNGMVQPAPDLDAAHPVLRLGISAVADFYRRSPNSNAGLLYWRDPATGQFSLFGEFDVECVSEVVGLLARKESS